MDSNIPDEIGRLSGRGKVEGGGKVDEARGESRRDSRGDSYDDTSIVLIGLRLALSKNIGQS